MDVGSGSGTEAVSYYSDGRLGGKQCVVCGPRVDVGAVGSGFLCCVGGRCPGTSCTDLGGALVIARSSGQVLSTPRGDACAARHVSIEEGDVSSESMATSCL